MHHTPSAVIARDAAVMLVFVSCSFVSLHIPIYPIYACTRACWPPLVRCRETSPGEGESEPGLTDQSQQTYHKLQVVSESPSRRLFLSLSAATALSCFAAIKIARVLSLRR
jgi:hypothetical protein